MERITRKSIAFDSEPLKEFDLLINKKGYKNRSEAIRDIIRNSLVEKKQECPDEVMVGTLIILYNHDDHDVQQNLTHIQHHSIRLIISSLHVHLDKHNCLEILVLKGKVSLMSKLADNIIATKGVKHGKLVLTAC